MEMSELVGTYDMKFWRSVKNGVPDGYPMGEDAKGQIIYSREGHMSAFLMRQDHKNSTGGTEASSAGIIAYGGTWRLDDDRVIHDVEFATLPHWIGHPLVRFFTVTDGGILLKTAPEFSKSGNRYEHELMWMPVAGTEGTSQS